ncbi:MAG TPA: LD-carboxypeptidase [Cryptosporangiaceae bacterium]|nr:LD-carboxypeptidase [Cryptosporangiaceae bacterium]
MTGSAAEPLPPLIRPPRLRPGDRIAVVAPSGPVDRERLDAGCAVLRGWGLRVECMPHVLARHDRLPYLAGSDDARAADLQQAWLDPSVAAVLCVRGGYGAQRIVDLLDWSRMRHQAPKIFAGSSDVTALHEAFATQLGVVTLFAPMVGSTAFVDDATTREHLRRMLFAPESTRLLTSARTEPLIGGRARGVTIGGTATLLAAGVGTPATRPAAPGGIAILEDVTEDAYRLDRILTQLLRAGWFTGVTAVALGSWVDCEPSADVRALALDRLGGLGVPVVWELGFGHCLPQLTVPLGVRAELDADAGTLTLLDPPLR